MRENPKHLPQPALPPVEIEKRPVGTAVVIVNPVAGRGRVRKMEPEIVSALDGADIDYTLVHTRAEWHATELAREAAEQGAETIIAVGGDGTVHEVATGMWDSDAVLGVIPMGSGNDFAGSRGIPEDPERAVEVIKGGAVTVSDVGTFGENYFFNTIGIGFNAAVSAFSRRHKLLRGYLLYLVTVLQSLFRYRSIPLLIESPGFRRDDLTYLLVIGIGNREGGGFKLVPGAVIDDGLFELCIVDDISIPTALRVLPKATAGKHTDLPIVTMVQVPSLHITAQEPILLHADGQLYETGKTELEVGCRPRALKVRVAP